MKKTELKEELERALAHISICEGENLELREALFEQAKNEVDLINRFEELEKTFETISKDWFKIKVEVDGQVEELKAQLLDEKEVGIRARRIYRALQSDVYPNLTLSEKAKNLYLFTIWKFGDGDIYAALKRWNSAPDEEHEVWMQYFIEISSGEMLETLAY